MVGTAAVLAVLLSPAHGAARTWWHPAAATTWYWQLQGRVSDDVDVDAYDVDGIDTPAAEVSALHAQGRHVICYIDVGTWESWRSDAADFPRSVLGNPNGWPGERWLNLNRLAVIEPIMARRFAMCAAKHFDAVEPDNLDSQGDDPGFHITLAQQLRYARWVAAEVHSLGMAVLQKNDPEQTAQLEPDFDGALVEQCNAYQECGDFMPYVRAHKPVLNAEYSSRLYPGFCTADRRRGLVGALYDQALDGRGFRPCFRT